MRFLAPATILALTLFTATATPQEVTRVIPRALSTTGAYRSSDALFPEAPIRVQQIVNARNLNAPLILRSLSLAPYGTRSSPRAGQEIDLEIRLGHTSRTAAQMTPSFAANATGPLTTVFRQRYRLPDIPANTGTAGFTITLPFQIPFRYSPEQGHLLIEWTKSNTTPGLSYPLEVDSVFFDLGFSGSRMVPTGGNPTGYPLTCAYEYRNVPFLDPTRDGLSVAHTLTFTAHAVQTVGTAFVFGTSSSSAFGGAVDLPLSLDTLGAPGNTLFVSPEAFLPATRESLPGPGFVLRDRTVVTLPVDSWLVEASYFVQGLILIPGVNELGAAFTTGHEIRLRDFHNRFGHSQVVVGDPNADRGSFLAESPSNPGFARGYTSPVIALRGFIDD